MSVRYFDKMYATYGREIIVTVQKYLPKNKLKFHLLVCMILARHWIHIVPNIYVYTGRARIHCRHIYEHFS
jgi:hypothetical protein